MTIRIAQQGQGTYRDLVVVYYLASACDPQVLKAAGPDAIVCNDTRSSTAGYHYVGAGGVEPLRDLVPRLESKLGCYIRSVTLAGYSAGCRAVRSQLEAGGLHVDAVVAADGTHADLPPREAQLAPWRSAAHAARMRASVFAASHTMLTYVERLPHPYASTWTVLKEVTGFPLTTQGTRAAPYVSEMGYCSVRSYASDACDRSAHAHQGHTVLPLLLGVARGQLAELLAAAGRLGRGVLPSEHPAPKWRDKTLGLGQRAVAWSLEQVDTMRESPAGSNAGPDVARVLAPAIRGGKRLGITVGNWCAGLACYAEDQARLPGDHPPVHEYRCSGIELEQDARAAGAWRPAELARNGAWVPSPGDLVLWQRGTGPGSWQRHVARVVRLGDGTWDGRPALPNATFVAVGGNEMDTVRVGPRRLDDPALRGFIELPRHPDCATQAEPLDVDLACVDVTNDGDDVVA